MFADGAFGSDNFKRDCSNSDLYTGALEVVIVPSSPSSDLDVLTLHKIAIIPADVVSYRGPDAISGIIIAGGFPWRSMHGEVANPWIIEFIPRLLANDLNQWGETVKDFVESCVAYPDKMPQITKYAWMGGVSGQHPQVRLLALPRGQDESALLSAKDKLPFLVLQGTMDKHVLGDKLEKFMHSNFTNVEFHMWDHCGHAPFYDRPEEFNRATLDWVDKITKVI